MGKLVHPCGFRVWGLAIASATSGINVIIWLEFAKFGPAIDGLSAVAAIKLLLDSG
jgi:hypothetical protein